MFRTKKKPGLAATAARGLVDDAGIRGAAFQAAPPVAKLGVNIGKRFAKRRARRRVDQLSDTITTVANLVAAYGPMLVQRLGITEEPPKRRRTAPLVAGGALLGASAVYFLEPGQGRRHRRQLQKLVSH